jgi:hypothetical protein
MNASPFVRIECGFYFRLTDEDLSEGIPSRGKPLEREASFYSNSEDAIPHPGEDGEAALKLRTMGLKDFHSLQGHNRKTSENIPEAITAYPARRAGNGWPERKLFRCVFPVYA